MTPDTLLGSSPLSAVSAFRLFVGFDVALHKSSRTLREEVDVTGKDPDTNAFAWGLRIHAP